MPLFRRTRLAAGPTPFLDERRQSAIYKIGSTRLNSSHGYISYAVFCLKKKKKKMNKLQAHTIVHIYKSTLSQIDRNPIFSYAITPTYTTNVAVRSAISIHLTIQLHLSL